MTEQDYKKTFIELCVELGVLRFGEFTLKSGRVSPYFFDAGRLNTGRALNILGRAYAQVLNQLDIHFDLLYGPAYKGIPIVASTASALFEHYQRDVPWVFDRKEAKDHGEGGQFVGAALQGSVVLLDDVITRGTAFAEAMDKIAHSDAEVVALVVALDRQERGDSELSAIQNIEQKYQISVQSILSLEDILRFAEGRDDEINQRLITYREQYGI